MTPLLKAVVIIEPILLLTLLILAIVAYNAKRTIAFLLLMLASICYFLPRFAPFAIGLFFEVRGWKTSGSMRTWFHSWWSFGLNKTFDFLFLGLIIAAFVFFIRERRRIVTPHA
jgi:hypothetical protein